MSKEDTVKEIGKITRERSPMPEKNGDSNVLKAGSKLYEIKDRKIDDFIAVERDGSLYTAKTLK